MAIRTQIGMFLTRIYKILKLSLNSLKTNSPRKELRESEDKNVSPDSAMSRETDFGPVPLRNGRQLRVCALMKNTKKKPSSAPRR